MVDEFCVEKPWGEDYDIDSDKADTNTEIPHFGTRRRLRSVFPDEYCTLGSPTAICGKCNARMWKEERVNKYVSQGTPIFSICCKRGEVKLPPTPATPPYLQIIYNDPLKSITFLRNIGIYNAIFSFTSAGGNVDHSIYNGRGPYIYRLNGQNHHVFGSLIPDDGETPKFCQLYIYDTANEVNNRLRWVNASDKTQFHAQVVEGLLQMLDQTNELCKEFRMARDRFENNDLVDLKVELKVCRSQSGRKNHISASNDVAGVMVGSSDNTTCDRDIIIEPKMGRLRRVSYVHPKFMALQYPILFPNDEDGYHDKIPFTSADPNNLKDHDMISMKKYYTYRFQVRDNEGFKRYMQQNFQDALAVCRHVGHPNIFLTMTTNPLWDEIQRMMEFLPGCHYSNSPDIISRVFCLKLDQLTHDIKKKSYFGKCIGIMYVVEFQKRGLPHVHMLIWLDAASKVYLKKNVDKFVSAEIPDPIKDPVGYESVKMFMMHGPCGLQNLKSPCMKGFKCTRFFPKKYCPRTTFDESGFPIYKRRRQNITIKKGKAELDNQWVVPYNRDLLGHDIATVKITGKKRKSSHKKVDEPIDEINAYFDGHYVCGAEAAYRIFGFPIHHRTLSVERLPFHLPDQKNCTFRADGSLQEVAEKEKQRLSKLEAFFVLNKTDSNARKFTYDEIPQHYVWNDTARSWKKRQRGLQIGRLSYCDHSSGEVWYLRILITKVRGPTSFEELRTINGVCFSSFKDACKEYGLLDHDKEWHEVIKQCSTGGLPPRIRQLFVHIIVNCKVTDLGHLWKCHWGKMIDDILLKRRNKTHDPKLELTEMQLQFYALAEIDDLLRSIGKSLKHFGQLPQPPSSYLNHGLNNLIIEETS
ncbi:uncharacterized protein LOC141673679 [Apium graveolens]|uniref:uncharacterized protein LOC141673679 n=1 Tax=Apium graveolens TaxID=4045 RepID=UPI003D7AF303